MALKGMGGLGGMGGGGMQKMLENMQKKLKEDAEAMQARLDEAQISGTAGGGIVTAVVNGHGDIMDLDVSPDAIDPSDKAMLQDLILSAVRDAQGKAEAMRDEEQKKLIPAGIPGMNLPGLF